jgi:hypothetical protein
MREAAASPAGYPTRRRATGTLATGGIASRHIWPRPGMMNQDAAWFEKARVTAAVRLETCSRS